MRTLHIFTLSLRATFIFSLLLLGSACEVLDTAPTGGVSSNTPSAPSAAGASLEIGASFASDYSKYRVGVGDNLAVHIWRRITVTVGPDGKISVPLAGDFDVGGRSLAEVSSEITQILSDSHHDYFVTVMPVIQWDGPRRPNVRVIGAVREQSSLPYRPGMTVLSVLDAAGGVEEVARLGGAILYRSDGSSLPIQLDHLLNRADMATNYIIQPGDVVVVAKSTK